MHFKKLLYNILSADWAKFTNIPDEHVMPSLARVRLESLSQVNDSWTVTQDLVPVPKYRFARWKGRCRESEDMMSVCSPSQTCPQSSGPGAPWSTR